MVPEAVLISLRAAVDAAPDDIALRMHLAELLAGAGHRDEAVRHAAGVLQRDPSNTAALALISAPTASGPAAGEQPDAEDVPDRLDAEDVPSRLDAEDVPSRLDAEDVLSRLDAEFADVVPPQFVRSEDEPDTGYRPEFSSLSLADVAGMTEVKARLEAAVLAPLRNPELGRLYGKSLRGGLLLYGPPGCGKTFIARAVAGEMGARFLTVSLADILDMYIGQSERNVHELFELARREAPCVIFFDEVDALGQKRSQQRSSASRGTVNQLLSEMDGLASANEGVFVLGATNHPWDVDVALRRPGRFDRMLLVLPPDESAREGILRYHLQGRPVANIDVRKLARRTDGYSGADLAYLCEAAAERALMESASTSTIRLIGMPDLEAALADLRPSIGPWLDTARNVAQFANKSGSYDDLLGYLRKRKLL